MRRYLPWVLGVLAVGLLLWRQQGQQAEIDSLRADMRLLKADAELPEGGRGPETVSGAPRDSDEGEAGRPAAGTPRPRAQGDAAGSDAPAAPEAPRVGDRAWTRQAPEAAHDELLELLASDDPAVRARVREVVEAAEEERRDERREQWQQRWESHTLERLGTLGQQVSLSQQQQDALFAILTVARDRAAEVLRQSREQGGDFREAREQLAKFREDARSEARELLDAKQYEAFEQMMEEERGRGAGRRGGGGPPP